MNQLPSSPSRYLDGRVTTASQPELQLMLLDGALRFGRQAQELWAAADKQAECERLLGRALDIVEELVYGAAAGKTEASKRLEEEYAFAFRQLVAAQLNHDAAPLEAALKLLAFQRETWKLTCERLKAKAIPAAHAPLSAATSAPIAGHGLSLQG